MSDDMKDTRGADPGSVSDASASAATDEQQSFAAGAHAGTTRRRFTRASLGVAPVALALMHRPALAQTLCESPSGFESANLSNKPNENYCQGGTPGYWRATRGGVGWPWPSPYLRHDGRAGYPPAPNLWQNLETWSYDNSGGTLISEAFPGCDLPGVVYVPGGLYGGGELTMMQVLLLQGDPGGDPYQLGGHLVAALLNAASGWTDVLSEDDVKKIWNDHFCGGGFQPTGAAQPWSAEMIVMYLQSTMTRS